MNEQASDQIIRALRSNTQDYTFDAAEVRNQLDANYAMNAALILGSELTLEIPAFHHDVWRELVTYRRRIDLMLTGHLQKAFTVPREHSKTTILKIFITNAFRFSSLRFLLYTGATYTNAANCVRDVVEWLLSENQSKVWGLSFKIKSNESEGLWILDIADHQGRRKRVILRAIGRRGSVRGLNIDSMRPDLLVFDDIEDLETADGGEMQAKLDEWFFGTVLKASAKRSLRIYIGNIIRSTTLLARLAKDEDWNPTNYGALVRNKQTGALQPLWPGMHTVESLLADYRSFRRRGLGSTWESEMMNLARDIVLQESLPDTCLTPIPSAEYVESGFICLDPAFGLDSNNDDSAITVHARLKNLPVPAVIDSFKGKGSERYVFDRIMDAVYRWGLRTIVIEAVAAQRLLIPLFRAYAEQINLPPDVLIYVPISGANVSDAKFSRIRAFRNALITGDYVLADSQIDLKLELEAWSADAKHDDLPDSAALGQLAWDKCGAAITLGAGRIQDIGSLLYPGRNETAIGDVRPKLMLTPI